MIRLSCHKSKIILQDSLHSSSSIYKRHAKGKGGAYQNAKLNTNLKLLNLHLLSCKGVNKAKVLPSGGMLPRLEVEFNDTALGEVKAKNLIMRLNKSLNDRSQQN